MLKKKIFCIVLIITLVFLSGCNTLGTRKESFHNSDVIVEIIFGSGGHGDTITFSFYTPGDYSLYVSDKFIKNVSVTSPPKEEVYHREGYASRSCKITVVKDGITDSKYISV